jgi:hypothetical protein
MSLISKDVKAMDQRFALEEDSPDRIASPTEENIETTRFFKKTIEFQHCVTGASPGPR